MAQDPTYTHLGLATLRLGLQNLREHRARLDASGRHFYEGPSPRWVGMMDALIVDIAGEVERAERG